MKSRKKKSAAKVLITHAKVERYNYAVFIQMRTYNELALTETPD